MARNVELKVRLASLAGVRRIAARLATEHPGHQRQVDTYFHCRRGRLKLREIDGATAQLVWYERPNRTSARTSNYLLVPVGEPRLLKQALAAALGVRVVVDKRREIFLYRNVRIHLDRVRGLGSFLEFEAVLGPGIGLAAARRQVAWLREQFSVDSRAVVAGSYSDLLS
jgi:predicted adenylyl cyclase CyaB